MLKIRWPGDHETVLFATRDPNIGKRVSLYWDGPLVSYYVFNPYPTVLFVEIYQLCVFSLSPMPCDGTGIHSSWKTRTCLTH